MESVNETPKLMQNNENPQNIDFNKQNWNSVTSQAFLKSYIRYLLTIDKKKDADGGETVDELTQNGKRALTEPSTSSDAKRLKLDCEHPTTGEYQLKTITKTNDWHQKLCKCSKCLKMYEDYNIEFLFGIKTIEWLPTEILLTIFTHLMPSDRRVASGCCNRFLDIWLRDTFIDDRHLVFDKCVLDSTHEQLSTFLRSTRNYRTLALDVNIMRQELELPAQLRDTVTTIEIKHFVIFQSFNISSLLSQFPNLKIIKVKHNLQLINFSEVPPTLELLVISGIDWNRGDELNMLKCHLDKTPESHRVELNDFIKTEQILKFTEAQRNKIQRVHLKLEANDKTFRLPHFGNLKNLKFNFERTCDYGTEDILDDIEEKCPTLKDLSIAILYRLPHKNWKCLKKLTALEIPMAELSRLSIFENLKELSINTRDTCFFVHETILNKNLKELTITVFSKLHCFTCFETMTQSFPNLENLTYRHKITNNHLNALAKNTRKLKCCGLGKVDFPVSFECLPNLTELTVDKRFPLEPKTIRTWPLMQHLRKLTLRFRRFDIKTVTMFGKMSALEDLRVFCDYFDDDQVSLFETMSKSLKRLEKFQFYCYKKLVFEDEVYDKVVDVMVENCNYLRYINFDNVVRERETWKKLLQRHPSLRAVNGCQWLEK